MNRKTLTLLAFFLFRAFTLFGVQNILILGDSHFVGHFGEYVHKNLHETGRYDVFSIAISGAGSKHYTMTLKNFCCGYKIRYSCVGVPVEDQNAKHTNGIHILEKSSAGNNGIIGKPWKGKLSLMMHYWMPDIVVFSLGSNNVNAHQSLVDIIRSYREDIPIIWIGPFRRKGNDERYKLIEKTVNENKDVHLVRSDDIIGHDTITMAHYYGKSALKWANKVTDRMKPILDKIGRQ